MARGVPDQARAFLLALFVVDDVAALLLVIFAYGDAIRPAPALLALGSFSALLIPRKWAPAASRRTDLLFGADAWAALMFSGIEPPVAGLLIGLATTARAPQRTDLEHATGLVRLFRHQPPCGLQPRLRPWLQGSAGGGRDEGGTAYRPPPST